MIGKTLGHYQITSHYLVVSRIILGFLVTAVGHGSSGFVTISAPAWEQESSPSTLTVTKLADTNDGTCDSDCSLREALATAAPDDTVEFASALRGTFILKNTLNISKNVTINGPSTSSITISGNNAVRVLNVSYGIEFKIRNLTIARGRVKGEPGSFGKPGQPGSPGAAAKGGGLYNDGGIVTILNCTFWNNRAIGGSGGKGGVAGVGDPESPGGPLSVPRRYIPGRPSMLENPKFFFVERILTSDGLLLSFVFGTSARTASVS